MEKHKFQKKPPRGSGYFSPVSKNLLNISTSPSVPDSNRSISDIIQEEHIKLQRELQKLSNLRSRAGIFPPPSSPPNPHLDITLDTEEFNSLPLSPVPQKSSPIIYQIHRKAEDFTWKSQTTSDFFHIKNTSVSSEELMLSTYEDSLVLSPQECRGPRYVRTNNKQQSPKLFVVRNERQVGRSGSGEESGRSDSGRRREALVSRLAVGGVKRMSKKEMHEVNRRFYEKLPEVVEGRKKEARELERKVIGMYAKGLQQKNRSSRKNTIFNKSGRKE